VSIEGLSDLEIWSLIPSPRVPQSSRPGVFAAGDIVNGGATVVEAVAEGTRAARSIDTYLTP